jgi:hypothetical protein
MYGWAASTILPITGAYRTLGTGVLYAMTMVGVLAVVAKLH